jgi:hypothetical protein
LSIKFSEKKFPASTGSIMGFPFLKDYGSSFISSSIRAFEEL